MVHRSMEVIQINLNYSKSAWAIFAKTRMHFTKGMEATFLPQFSGVDEVITKLSARSEEQRDLEIIVRSIYMP